MEEEGEYSELIWLNQQFTENPTLCGRNFPKSDLSNFTETLLVSANKHAQEITVFEILKEVSKVIQRGMGRWGFLFC